MVKCPKCGVKSWEYYNPILTLDTDFDDDEMIQINKVECYECHYQYVVKEFYHLRFEESYNVD